MHWKIIKSKKQTNSMEENLNLIFRTGRFYLIFIKGRFNLIYLVKKLATLVALQWHFWLKGSVSRN